jgi:hypothetical protein
VRFTHTQREKLGHEVSSKIAHEQSIEKRLWHVV